MKNESNHGFALYNFSRSSVAVVKSSTNAEAGTPNARANRKTTTMVGLTIPCSISLR